MEAKPSETPKWLTNKTVFIFCAFILLVFAVVPIVKHYPYNNTIETLRSESDDWADYIRHAEDICTNGLLMPSVEKCYYKPAGFLYNYFLALVFTIAGHHSMPVFFIQYLLAGASALFLFLAFRKLMKPLTSIVFLFAASAFMLTDIVGGVASKLLSENLVVFTLSLFLFFLFRSVENRNRTQFLLSAVFLGATFLTRPNIGLFLPFFFLLLWLNTEIKSKFSLKYRMLYIFIFVSISLLLPLRNVLTGNDFCMLPIRTDDLSSYFINDDHSTSFVYYIKKMLYFTGIFKPLEPDFANRYHWLILWSGLALFIIFKLKKNRKFSFYELVLLLFIVSYTVFHMVVSVNIGNYGYRFLIPLLLFLLPFPFIAFNLTGFAEPVSVKGRLS